MSSITCRALSLSLSLLVFWAAGKQVVVLIRSTSVVGCSWSMSGCVRVLLTGRTTVETRPTSRGPVFFFFLASIRPSLLRGGAGAQRIYVDPCKPPRGAHPERERIKKKSLSMVHVIARHGTVCVGVKQSSEIRSAPQDHASSFAPPVIRNQIRKVKFITKSTMSQQSISPRIVMSTQVDGRWIRS
ncbi:hypothetical protein F5B20DRAFT_357250 [Whalleya microplaca]|nr:hypothetical protein F5B20DRAFT_357250 [Whalleya microplaca]